MRPVEKREELYTNLVTNDISVALLQEIWLKEQEQVVIKKYNFVSKRREGGYGGVGILLRKGIQYKNLKLPNFGPLEAVGVEINQSVGHQVKTINLLSVYLPPGNNLTETKKALQDIFTYLESLVGETIVGGDLNGHHSSWSPEYPECARGRYINTLIEGSKLMLLNDGTATMIGAPGGRESAIDLTLATTGVARKAAWMVQDEELGGAHLCIWIELETDIPIVNRRITRINKSKVVEELNSMRPQFIYSPEEMVEIFDEAVKKASFVVKNKKANYLKTWWTDKIGKLYSEKRVALRAYNVNKNQQNYIVLQRSRAQFKKEVRKEKRKYIGELSEKIDEATPSRHLWNIVKGIDTSLSGEYKTRTEITLEKGTEFMEYYFKDKVKPIQKPTACTEYEIEGYEMALKDEELLGVLKSRKNSSVPGENKISYDMLKQLTPEMQMKICEMLSRVFVTEKIAERWRRTEIRPIEKKKYRPTIAKCQKAHSVDECRIETYKCRGQKPPLGNSRNQKSHP
ncbi:uncharacterized protein LOC131675919 [Topomyia yanbarensis]|uniref:uncharacterized protein LOC131675919 n=1 Tax=Topomyia yanbarensis TaxID=2498891 RepID=UPI00273AA927|nr:uncharacterized protein LOC131675919 [Topomyia yanbarensis]